MSKNRYSKTEWTAFEVLVDANLDQGLWRFEKELRIFVERVGWDWVPVSDKHDFHKWATTIYKQAARRRSGLRRQKQLQEANFALWVMQGYDPMYCPAEHSEIKGIVLSPDHPFWGDYLPPNDWTCSCYVSGTRSEAGARRLRGNPELTLPHWWTEKRGVKPHFRDNHLPDLREVVELLHCGFFE